MARRKADLSSGLVLLDDQGEPTTREEMAAEAYGATSDVMEAAAAPEPPAKPPATPLAAPFVTTAGAGKYRVALNCPTPLAHRELDIEADNEEDAKKKFCEANTISGSDHTWRVEKVA